MSSLYHLIYVSRAVPGLADKRVAEILTDSRARNQSLGITGMLLHAGESFIQTLEGARDAVEAVYASIERDIRHTGVTALVREPIAARGFPNWSMGFERLPHAVPWIKDAHDAFAADPAALREKLSAASAEVKGLMLGFVDLAAQHRRPSGG